MFYGISTIYNSVKEIFYKGYKMNIIFPSIHITRGHVISNTKNMVSDYPSENNNLTRNIIRKLIDIDYYYENIINYINLVKFFSIINKYSYNYKNKKY